MSDKPQADYAAYGARGGDTKERNRNNSRDAAVDDMPPLNSEANCKLRLEHIQNLTLRGLLAGSQAGAAVRACEVWLKANQAELDRNRMRELERQMEELERQLSASRVRRVG